MERRSNWKLRLVGLGILVALIFIVWSFSNRNGGYVDVVNFSDMEYERPDAAALYEKMDEALRRAEKGSFSGARKAMADVYREYAHILTMDTLADIRYSLDVTDEYYKTEYEYTSGIIVEASAAFDSLYAGLAETEAADKLEEDYFGEGFFDGYDGYTSEDLTEMARLLEKENEAEIKYRQIIGDRSFEYGGDVLPYSALRDGSLSDEEYDAAERAYYSKYNPILGEVFIELVKTRRAIASACGYGSYAEYAYENIHGRDYTPDEVRGYTEDIARYLVPVFKAAAESGKIYDYDYYLADEEDMMAYLENIAENMGGEVKDALEFMTEYNLYDISASPQKREISFQTYIKDYESPYLFINPTGYSNDLFTVSHEFGHYTDAFANYNASSDTDTAETFSQGLEYLGVIYNSLGDSKAKEDIKKAKMADSLMIFIEQASLNEFEERVYSLPEEDLTVENINEIYCQVTKDFGYYVPEYDEYYRESWIDITHLFEYPYYVASYVVSNDAAMQIYELETASSGDGAGAYESLLDRNPDESFLKVLEGAGMKSPFDGGRVKELADIFKEFYGV